MSKQDPFVPDIALYDLAFDQFSRQYQAKKLIEAVRAKRKLKILDVGGHNGVTRQFFPDDEVMIVDLYDIEEPGYTKASALDLPFDDGSYDIVTCFDVFEHIEPGNRARFLLEITRVAKSYVLVAAPFDTEYVAAAERELNQYYATITGNEHRWLSEHIENGLPECTEIEQFFREARIPVQTYNNNNILLWTAMQNLIFLADAVKAPQYMLKLNHYYNQNLSNIGDAQEPSYRRIYFAIKDGAAPKRLEIEQPVSLEVVQQWINQAAVAIHQLIYGSEPLVVKTEVVKVQTEVLAEKDREIAGLHNQLEGMKTQTEMLTEVLAEKDREIAGLHNQLEGMKTQAEMLTEVLAEKDREIAGLHNQLDKIRGSRSYRIAQVLSTTKKAILPKRRT